jgi:hypothetical protein
MNRMWPLIFCAIGVALLIYGIGLVRDARNCATWPSVEGRIMSAEAQVVSREKDRRTYAPNVTYAYVVDGKNYEGRRVTLVPRNYSQLSAVQAALAPYSPGATARVFHHPTDHGNSVLIARPTGTEWAYPLAGAVFLVIGAVWFGRS